MMSNLKPNIDTSLFKLNDTDLISDSNQYSPSTSSDISLDTLKKEFDSFERIDIEDESHKKELDAMFPGWLIPQASKRDLKRFMTMSRYDRKKDIFVGGCFENAPWYCNLVSYKRRRLPAGKWITRKGTHPNSSLFFVIYPDAKPIFFVEGIHDALTAVLLGINFIMIPYSGYKCGDPSHLKREVEGRDVVFLVEDGAAYSCMSRVAGQIDNSARSIMLLELDDTKEKMDVSEYIRKYKTIQEVRRWLAKL